MQILTGAACASFHAALQSPPPVSVRLNPAKGPADPGGESVSWCSCGYYLKERPSFTFDPLFHAGAYYVQEASSMFLEQAIRAHVSGPVTCLDLCAAPGGKSTHLQALLPAGSLLVSNEILKSRAAVLQENLIKWGNPGALVTSNHPAEMSRLPHFFDVVVADLPCSGEGMFRKDPSSAAQWSANNVAGCALRQRRILHDCWDALKPGGLLIYCTCTYNIEENEDNLQYIIQTLGGEALPVPVRDEWKITGALKYNHPAYRFFPHLTRGEGFFLAVIQKQEGRALPVRNEKGRKNGDARRNLSPDVSHWLKHPSDFLLEMQGDHIAAFPRESAADFRQIAGRLHVISGGVRLGRLKGTTVCPCHALAMSTAFNPSACSVFSLNRAEAIRYLRKEPLVLPGALPKGYVLLTHQNYPLGFAKQLGNRANNLYPSEWRIRSNNPKDIKDGVE